MYKNIIEKIDPGKIIVAVVFLIALSFAFYWFEWRPAQIRHDCSWVKVVNPPTPAEPAVTKEDVKNSQLEYDKCIANGGEDASNYNPFVGLFTGKMTSAELQEKVKNNNNQNICDTPLKQESLAIPAKPETEWYEKASKNEYDFCIHEKGL